MTFPISFPASGKAGLHCCLVALTLLLCACGTTSGVNPVSNPGFASYQTQLLAVEHWQLSGRLTARQNNNSDRVSLNWKQDAEQFDITLWGALGLGTTRIFGSDQGLVVEKANEAPVQLANLQALSQEYLSFDFPASYLMYWARGLPAPDLPSSLNFDANNLLVTLTQTEPNGRSWQLSFDRYQPAGEGFNLPGRIRVISGDIQLTLLVDDWQLAPASEQ